MRLFNILQVGRRFTRSMWFFHGRSAAVVLLMASIALGCAQAKVTSRQDLTGGKRLPPPSRILVYNFEVPPANVALDTSVGKRVARSGTSQAEQARRIGEVVADALSRKLVEEIRKLGLPAERAYGAPLPKEWDIVIDGQFLMVDEGHQAVRFVIGFGLGATEVRTQVQVYQIGEGDRRLVKQFRTVAKGSKMPGLATPMGIGGATGRLGEAAAVGMGVGVAKEIMGGIEGDAARTAKEISKVLDGFFMRQGWGSAHAR